MKPFNKQFPAEIYPLILIHLRNPIPLPNSYPARSEIYQPHLAQGIRVNKESSALQLLELSQPARQDRR